MSPVMTPQEKRVLVAQLWATRASVDAALTALGAFDDAAEADESVCMHPIDERIDETTMGGPEGWRCRVCGFSTLEYTDDNPSNTPQIEES